MKNSVTLDPKGPAQNEEVKNGAVQASERLVIQYAEVGPDPDQPRKEFPKAEMEALQESIRVNGIQDPIVVRALSSAAKAPGGAGKGIKYMIVEGERRWRCAGVLKLETLPVVVRAFKDEAAVRQYQRIVGTQRLNLSLLEQAQDLARELGVRREKNPKFSPEDLAAELGMSRANVYERLKLTRLTEPVAAALRGGEIVAAVAVALCQLPTEGLQVELLKSVIEEGMSVRDLAGAIRDDYLKPLSGVKWDLAEEYAVDGGRSKEAVALPTFGKKSGKLVSCELCPLRTGNMLGQFPELKDRPNVCTCVDCFKVKAEIGVGIAFAKAKAEGRKVVPGQEYRNRSYEYEEVGDTCWSDKENRKWGVLAKEAGVKPMVTVNHAGEVIEVLKRSDLGAIKKACGIKEHSYSNGVDQAKVRAFQKKKKEFVATAGKASAVILEKLVRPATDGSVVVDKRLWKFLAGAAYHALDITRHDFVAKRRGLAKTQTEVRSALEKFMKGVTDPVEQARLTVDLLLCSAWSGGGWQSVSWGSEFKELCQMAGGMPEVLAQRAEASIKPPAIPAAAVKLAKTMEAKKGK